MEDPLSCWDGLLEFYHGLNLTKIARGISSDPSCALKPSIFGEFIRQFSNPLTPKSAPTPAPKTQSPNQAENAGGLARTLFVLTLRLDLLVFSKQATASVSAKQEFSSAVSKTRSELRRSFKAAMEAVAAPQFQKFINIRPQLVCALHFLKQFLATDPESIVKLHFGPELMTFLCLVANIWIATNLDDKELATLLAENFALLLANFDDKIGPSQVFEFVSHNLLFLADSPLEDPHNSEFKRSISNLNLKTENAAKILIQQGVILPGQEASYQKLLIFSRKTVFGLRVLFGLAHIVLEKADAQVLRVSSGYHILVTNSLNRVCTNPLESNIFNRMYAKKLLKLADELFSRCPQLARLYGGKALDAITHGHLKSVDHFNLLQPKALALTSTLFSVPELRDSCIVLTDKMLIFPTAQLTINSTLQDSGDDGTTPKSEGPNSQHKLSLEDGKVTSLEEILDISTTQKASEFVIQTTQLANKILDHCMSTETTNLPIFVQAFNFLTDVKIRVDPNANFDPKIWKRASDVLAIGPKISTQIPIHPPRSSVELGLNSNVDKPKDIIVTDWLSFRDQKFGVGSEMGNMTFRGGRSDNMEQSGDEHKRSKDFGRKMDESLAENSFSFRNFQKVESIESSLSNYKIGMATPRFGRNHSLPDESRSVNLNISNSVVSLATRQAQLEGRPPLDKRVKAGHLYTTGLTHKESPSPPSELSVNPGEPHPKVEFPNPTEEQDAKDLAEIDLT